jgi:predicted NACHT family NTPase
LFGLTVSEASRRYGLSVAYITLSATNPEITDESLEAASQPLAEADPTRQMEGRSGNSRSRASRKGTDEPLYVRIDRALAECSRVLIRGEAGSGKTTLLQWLAVHCARQTVDGYLEDWRDSLPFFIELSPTLPRTRLNSISRVP